jgi:hypothetical protein
VRTLLERRPISTHEPPYNQDIQYKIEELDKLQGDAGERLFLDLLMHQDPIHAVGVAAIDAISRLNNLDIDNVNQESVNPLEYAEPEPEISLDNELASDNIRLSEMGHSIDGAKCFIATEEQAELWLEYKRLIAELKTVPKSSEKDLKISHTQEKITKFLTELD